MFCDVSIYDELSAFTHTTHRDPDKRPSAAELRKHQYLELQRGWMFNGFK